MPRMDGTGPMGTGRPGRGLGPCGKGTRRPQGRLGRRFGVVGNVTTNRPGLGGGFRRGCRRGLTDSGQWIPSSSRITSTQG